MIDKKNKLYFALAILFIAIFGGVLFYNVKFVDEKFTSPMTLTLFYSPTCPHCVDFLPIWDGDASDPNSLKAELEKQNVQVTLRKVNVNDPANAELANAKKIEGVPTIILTKDGKDTEFTNDRTAKNIVLFVKSNST